MKVFFKMAFSLGITAAVAGLLLAFANQATISKIKSNQEKEIADSIYKLDPNVKKYRSEIVAGHRIYAVYDKNNRLSSYCILTSGNGYQGKIRILIGLALDFKTLNGIEILENIETPGLGGKISQSFFKNQFKKLQFIPRITYVKGRKPLHKNEVQAITGATISSSSVVKIVNKTLSETVPELKNEK